MAIGMTWEQYWYGDVRASHAFLEADRIRQKRMNQEKWLQGMYVYDALCKAAPILHAFARKGTKPGEYPSQPYSIDRKEKAAQQTDEEREAQEEQEALRARLYMHQMMWSGKNWGGK